MKKLAQGFNTAAQDSNPGPLSRESGALPLSHGALRVEEFMSTVVLLWSPHNMGLYILLCRFSVILAEIV